MAVMAVDGWWIYQLEQGELQHFEVEQDAIDRATVMVEGSSPGVPPIMILSGKFYKHVEE